MMLRFSKVSSEDSVDSHFDFSDPRVLVQLEDIPFEPTYPENPKYWGLFDDALTHVSAAKTRSRYTAGVAQCFENIGLTRADLCAEAVHHDRPSSLMRQADREVTSPLRDIGLRGVFTDKGVLLDHLMAKAAWMVSASSFCIKDHFKVPRPEEVAGAIVRGQIQCPPQILARLKDIPGWGNVANDQRTITMYPEGSPNHASWNAMHSAAASAVAFVIRVLRVLSDRDAHEITLAMLNVGGFRKSAFVHTEEDNILGYWLGQHVTKQWLRTELETLGANMVIVDSAIKEAWVDFTMAA